MSFKKLSSGKIAIAASGLAVLAIGAALYGHFAVPRAEELVCMGQDEASGRMQKVVIQRRSSNSGVARLLVEKGSNLDWQVEVEDALAVITGSANETTVTFKGEGTKSIHIVKACGSEPRCEIHRYQLPPAEALKQEQERTLRAEKEAFEFRRATARQAEEFAKVRARAMESSEKVEALKRKPGAPQEQLRAAEAERAKATDLANQMADRLYSMSATAHEASKQAEQVRSLSSLNKVDVDSTILKPRETTSWCH